MLDMRFFRNPRFSAASSADHSRLPTLFGTIFLLTQYFQSVLGYSTLKAGAMLIPQAVLMMIFAPLSTRWVHRFGNKVVVTAARRHRATSFALTSFQTEAAVFHVIAITALLGLGMAHVMPAATESIMGSLPREKAGVGSAMNGTTRQMGKRSASPSSGRSWRNHFTSSITAKLDGHVPCVARGGEQQRGSNHRNRQRSRHRPVGRDADRLRSLERASSVVCTSSGSRNSMLVTSSLRSASPFLPCAASRANRSLPRPSPSSNRYPSSAVS